MIATTSSTNFPAVIVGARCDCCGDQITTTGGCLRCTSSRQFCTCGVLVSCGCGRSTPHRCPNIVIVGTLVPSQIEWSSSQQLARSTPATIELHAARLPHDGTTEQRDPEHPCGDYEPGEGPGRCEGDGHYLCDGCRHHHDK
jgi:hypothetical protein